MAERRAAWGWVLHPEDIDGVADAETLRRHIVDEGRHVIRTLYPDAPTRVRFLPAPGGGVRITVTTRNPR